MVGLLATYYIASPVRLVSSSNPFRESMKTFFLGAISQFKYTCRINLEQTNKKPVTHITREHPCEPGLGTRAGLNYHGGLICD